MDHKITVEAEAELKFFIDLIMKHQPAYVFIYGIDSIGLSMNNKTLRFPYKDIATKGTAKTIKTGFASCGEAQLVFARHPTGHTSDVYWKNIAAELHLVNGLNEGSIEIAKFIPAPKIVGLF